MVLVGRDTDLALFKKKGNLDWNEKPELIFFVFFTCCCKDEEESDNLFFPIFAWNLPRPLDTKGTKWSGLKLPVCDCLPSQQN